MPRRGENIRKRKDGRWEGRYKTTNESNGIVKYCSVYGHSYSEVKSKLSEVKSFRQAYAPQKVTPITVGDALNMWRECSRLKHKGATEVKYEYLITKHIMPELGSIRLRDITIPLLNDFLYKKTKAGRLDGEGSLSSSYVRTIAVIVHSAIQYAIDEKLCEPINIKTIKPPVSKNEPIVLSSKEQQMLENSLLSDMDVTKLGVYISLNTGLRIGEICALSWSDIDLDERILHVRSTVSRVKASHESKQQTTLIIDKPKTKTSLRDIPISSKLYPVLQTMKQTAGSSYVVSDDRKFISPRTYEYR